MASVYDLLARSIDWATGNAKVQLTASTVPDTQRVPIKKVPKTVTLVNAVAITDTTAHYYTLTSTGLTNAEIQTYEEFAFHISDTHDQPLTLTLIGKDEAIGFVTDFMLYNESNLTTHRPVLIANNGGAGVGGGIKVIPALRGIYTDLQLKIQFSTAPTSGAITVKVVMR